jgi:hypothetical protein
MPQAQGSDECVGARDRYASSSQASQQKPGGPPVLPVRFCVSECLEERGKERAFVCAKSLEHFELNQPAQNYPLLIKQSVDGFLEPWVFPAESLNPYRGVNENACHSDSSPPQSPVPSVGRNLWDPRQPSPATHEAGGSCSCGHTPQAPLLQPEFWSLQTKPLPPAPPVGHQE